MAEDEALSILRQGAAAWNAWVAGYGSSPFLKGARLGVTDNVDLAGVNLATADLRHAFFDGINLARADFRGANLYGATLWNCHLNKAQFNSRMTIAQTCRFSGSSLSEANLSGAQLESADFTDTFCPYATFAGATLTGSNFRNANGTPLMTNKDVSDYVRSLFGGPVQDLVDSEIDQLRHLCAVFLTDFPDKSEMASARSAALATARLDVDEQRLRNIFRVDAVSRDDLTEFQRQLLVYIDGLKGVDFAAANLTECNLAGARFARADFRKANLSKTVLVGTDLSLANLSGAAVYGMSVWDVNLEGAIQRDLAVTAADRDGASTLSVDNIEVAQFIYLLLEGRHLRSIIDTMTSKVVLILGRFTEDRKPVLDAIRTELRKSPFGYVPIVFDSAVPTTRDTHETVTLLARMARLVIADITDARSIPEELVSIVEQLPSLPIQPILARGCEKWGMYDHIARYPWVLPIHEYQGVGELLGDLKESVIAPAEMRLRQPH